MAVGKKFHHYRLEEPIGRGGMGTVYRAFDIDTGRPVALKLLSTDLATDNEFRIRFRRESEQAAQLRHPNIIPIHHFGEFDGQLYIEMRLIEGPDLAALLLAEKPKGGLPPVRAVDIVVQVAGALDAAHKAGLVHRDVKPRNVLLDSISRGRDFVYLIDFGIAHAAADTRLTRTGMIIGTADYMAPERFQGGSEDHRVDVYALACLLYESLTARRPFPPEGHVAQMHAHLKLPPPRPSDQRPDIPAELDEVVARGMAKDPDQRFPSAGALAEAACDALPSPGSQRRGPAETAQADNRTDTRRDTSATPTEHRTRSSPEKPRSSPEKRSPAGRPGQPGGDSDTIAFAVIGVLGVLAVIVGAVYLIYALFFSGDNQVEPIEVNGGHVGVAVTPDGRYVYLTNYSLWPPWSSDTVSVIKTADHTVVGTITVGENPKSVAISPDGRHAYITNHDSGNVTVIDTRNRSVNATIPVGDGPVNVAITPDGRQAYVTNYHSRDVSVIDVSMIETGTYTVTDIDVQGSAEGVAITPDGRHAYITTTDSGSGAGTVSVIDTVNHSVTDTFSVLGAPQGVAVTPDGRHAYIANFGADTVSVIDTTTREPGNIPVETRPRSVAVSPDGRHAYVTNSGSDSMSVIDTATNSVIDTIHVGDDPRGVAVAPDGRHAYVADSDSGTLWVIDLKPTESS